MFVGYGAVGTMAFHDPCTSSTTDDGLVVTCSDPVDTLDPGAIFVRWRLYSFDFGLPAGAPNTTIGDHDATMSTSRPGECSRLHADETMTAVIVFPLHFHYEMTACLRGPDLSANERLVTAMLNSTKLANP
jgi:hypothetical protein